MSAPVKATALRAGIWAQAAFLAACHLGSSDDSFGGPPACRSSAAASPSAPVAVGTPVLQQVADVPLPGAAVRFDYQSLDTLRDRLYISHMVAGQVVVFDVKNRQVTGVIDTLPGVTGVLAVPELGKVYASVTGSHQVAVIDPQTLKVVARVGTITFPDGIAYAPDQKKVYVSDEAGGNDVVIDGLSDKVLTSIALGGDAGNTVYDPRSGCVLVAVQTRNQVVAIDPATDAVVGRYHFDLAAHPHGLHVDAARHRLFIANQDNATLLSVDLDRMQPLGTAPIGDAADVLAFDPVLQRLYVASESGVVSVFTDRALELTPEGTVTLPHGHTVAVDPRTHLVYFPLQDVNGAPLLRIMTATQP